MEAAISNCRPIFSLPRFAKSNNGRRFRISVQSATSVKDGFSEIYGGGNGTRSTMKKKSDMAASTNSLSKEELIARLRSIRIAIDEIESGKRSSSSSDVEERSTGKSVTVETDESKEQGKKQWEKQKGKQVKPLKQLSELSILKTEAADFKLVRPPSNFVKRSPVQSSSAPRDTNVAPNNAELENPKLELMKLAELKEVAKSRGVKGYSKLKKQELLNLLLMDNRSVTET